MQHDFILLDRSGSMGGSMWTEAISAVNSYVHNLTKEKVDTGVTLAVFDTGVDGKLDFQVIRDRIIPSTWRDVGVNEIKPRGSTPLNDATARIVQLADAGKYDKVAIIIMTDGHENASREYTDVTKIKALLDACRAKNWQVIFLGANFDNAAQAKSYGNAANQTVFVAAGNLAASASHLSHTRSAYGLTGATMDFDAKAKADLAKPKR